MNGYILACHLPHEGLSMTTRRGKSGGAPVARHWACYLCLAAYHCKRGDLPVAEPPGPGVHGHTHDWWLAGSEDCDPLCQGYRPGYEDGYRDGFEAGKQAR